jgi:hypothetical protein
MNKTTRYTSGLFTFAVCLICINVAQAENRFNNPDRNPYIQDVIEATVETEELDDAIKQIRDIREIEPKINLSIAPFHFRKQGGVAKTEESGVLCTQCHLNPPHRENEKLRSFLNMHTQFIDCLSCHYQAKDKQLSYAWFDESLHPLSSKEFPLRTPSDEVNAEVKEDLSLIPQNKAKIHPVYQDKLVTVSLHNDFSKRIEQQWESSNEEEKARIKLRLHAPIKEKGLKCTQCHKDQQKQLDLKALGASAEQVFSIENNIIAKFLEKADKDDKRIRLQGLLE